MRTEECFYRVSAKALVFDDQNHLLVFKDRNGEWEMPGGGWDHGEDYETCIRRELAEEVGGRVSGIGPLAFFYRCETLSGRPKICLVFAAQLENAANLQPADDDLVEARFVAKDEFVRLPFQHGEGVAQQYADQIWEQVEKNSENR